MATRVEWAERVERWERSGLSAEKFARREGYKPKQLYWWRWKLRSDGPSPSSPPSSEESPRFLPVHVVADVSPVVTEPIEIALPNGRVVRVRPGFDPATLKRVLALVAAAPSSARSAPARSRSTPHPPTRSTPCRVPRSSTPATAPPRTYDKGPFRGILQIQALDVRYAPRS
jgi:hypothetical protein